MDQHPRLLVRFGFAFRPCPGCQPAKHAMHAAARITKTYAECSTPPAKNAEKGQKIVLNNR